MARKCYIKYFITIILTIMVIYSVPIKVFAAGAMDSNPNTQLPSGSEPELRPGEENQKNQEKKEEEKKKEEIKKQTEWSDEEKKKMTSDQIMDYIKENYAIKDGVLQGEIGDINESQDVKETWIETLKKDGHTADDGSKSGSILSQLEDRTYGVANIYKRPKKNDPTSSKTSLDDMIDDADKFTSNGDLKYNADDLSSVSNTIFNILLTVGIIIAVLMGVIIGIKLMISGVEKKAQVKTLLMPYVVGCIIIFGGFGIWKLVVTILQNI